MSDCSSIPYGESAAKFETNQQWNRTDNLIVLIEDDQFNIRAMGENASETWPNMNVSVVAAAPALRAPTRSTESRPPMIPDHELVRLIGRGTYGEVWLAKSAIGSLRAVKVVYRKSFDHDRPKRGQFLTY